MQVYQEQRSRQGGTLGLQDMEKLKRKGKIKQEVTETIQHTHTEVKVSQDKDTKITVYV